MLEEIFEEGMTDEEIALNIELTAKSHYALEKYNPIFETALNVSLNSMPKLKVGSLEELARIIIDHEAQKGENAVINENDFDDIIKYNECADAIYLTELKIIFISQTAFQNIDKSLKDVFLVQSLFHELMHNYQHILCDTKILHPKEISKKEEFILHCMIEGHAQYTSTTIIANEIEKEMNMPKGKYTSMNEYIYLLINEESSNQLEEMLRSEKNEQDLDKITTTKLLPYNIGYAYMKQAHQKGMPIKYLHDFIFNPPKNYTELLRDVMPILRIANDKEDLSDIMLADLPIKK